MIAAHTEVRQVGCDRRLPAQLPDRHAAVVSIVALQALGRLVERNVEASVQRHFAPAGYDKRKGVAGFALNEWAALRLSLGLRRALLLPLLLLFPLHLIQLRLDRLELPLQRVDLCLEIAGDVC